MTHREDAEKMEEAWATQATLADLRVSQQLQEAKLRMAYMVASQPASVAMDAATPGGDLFSRDELRHQDDSVPPPTHVYKRPQGWQAAD